MMNGLWRTAASMAVLVSVTGCATVQSGMERGMTAANEGITSVVGGAVGIFRDDYLADTSDTCYRQRSELAEHGEVFDKQLVQSALVGAAAGGILAAMTGGNVAEGVLIGGGLGLAAGYLDKLQRDGKNANQIAMQAVSDTRTENAKIDRLLASFNATVACRKEQARVIRADLKAGRIDKAAASERMAQVRTRYDEDVTKTRQIVEQIAENSEGYAAVYNRLAADNNGRELEVREYKPRQRTAVVKKTVPKKPKDDTLGTLQASGAGKQAVNELQEECLTNVKKRDDCFTAVRAAEESSGDFDLG